MKARAEAGMGECSGLPMLGYAVDLPEVEMWPGYDLWKRNPLA